MKAYRLLKKTLFILFIISLPSCVAEEDLEGDIADEYVGTWNYRDKSVSKDATSVYIEKISSNEIKINNFHNLGSAISTTFRVSDHTLTIISTTVASLPINGGGTSTYSYDEITIEYYYDNENFEAVMWR